AAAVGPGSLEDRLDSELCDQRSEICRRDELRRVPQAAAPELARRLARAIASLLDLAANMAIGRRGLLYLAIASATLAATDDTPRGERSLGSARARQTATEYFSLSCPHCAEFALKALPEIRTRFTTSRPTRRHCRPRWSRATCRGSAIQDSSTRCSRTR